MIKLGSILSTRASFLGVCLCFITLVIPEVSFARTQAIITQDLAELDEGDHITLNAPIDFYFDSALLRPESLESLEQVALWLKANPEVLEMTVVAHTETFGSSGYNLKLSRERARTLRRLLLAEGLSVRRVFYQGQGERLPLVKERTVEDKINNRRVEFIVTRILPGLKNQKRTKPRVSSKTSFLLTREKTGKSKKVKKALLERGDIITAGKSKVSIRNGPSTLTLSPNASIRMVRAIQDYSIQKKTYTIKSAAKDKAKSKKADEVSPWLLALDNPPLVPINSQGSGPKRRTVIKRILRAGIMAIEHLTGAIKINTKNLFDVYALFPGGQIHVYDGNATMNKKGHRTLVKNGKDSKTVLFQDEHPTAMKGISAVLATNTANQHRVIPVPPTNAAEKSKQKKRPKVAFHYSKTTKGLPEQAIINEYIATTAIIEANTFDNIESIFPQTHRQECDKQDRACLIKYGQNLDAEWVVDVSVTKTPRHVRTTYSLLSMETRRVTQQTFHKFKSHNKEAPLRQTVHAANTHYQTKHDQRLAEQSRPLIGQDLNKKAVLVLDWNYNPQRYDSFAYSGQKIALDYLKEHSETIGIEGQHIKSLIDEHPDCDLTDSCLREIAGAFGASYILDGDLVQNIETPLENDLELRLYDQKARLLNNTSVRFKPVNGVLRQSRPLVQQLFAITGIKDKSVKTVNKWRSGLTVGSATLATLSGFAFIVGSVPYVQYLSNRMTVNDASLPLENRESAYDAGTKAIQNYEDYGIALQTTSAVLGAISAGLWGTMTLFFPEPTSTITNNMTE